MDYETLGDALVNDSLENDELYVNAESREETQTGKYDLERAKGFLSTVNPRLNISLYDHLADILKSVLRSKIPDAVEKLEELSHRLKKSRHESTNDLTVDFEIGEELQEFAAEKQMFYKFKTHTTDPSEAIKESDEDESESDEEKDENTEEPEDNGQVPDLAEVLPDLHYTMGRFQEAGIGLSTEEEFELTVALKDLATQYKLPKVKFWGKVFGLTNDYYVAEAPYQEGVVQEKFGWEVAEESAVEPEEDQDQEEKEGVVQEKFGWEVAEESAVEPEEDQDQEEKDNEDIEENDEDKNEEEEEEETEEAAEVKAPPPIPEPRQKVKRKIPPEPNGKGVNEYLYFVCTKPGHQWRVLPYMLPSHISEARHLKRFFTGDLEAQIRGCVPYPGKEAHYLRAQIARISATTHIAPEDYYRKAGEKADDEDEDEEEEDENENAENGGVVLNSKYEPKPTKYVFSEGPSAWCHYKRAILDQGRCIPMKLGEKADDEDNEEEEEEDDNDEDEEGKDEQEEPEILEAIVETEVPLLRNLSEDRGIGRLKPWTWKLSSKLVEEKAVLIMYSNNWPGAYTFYDGKNFDHIYIGYGFKYSVFHYAPPIRVSWQSEYEVGDDVTEHVDEEILPKDETEDTEDAEDEEKIDEEETEDTEENGEAEEDS